MKKTHYTNELRKLQSSTAFVALCFLSQYEIILYKQFTVSPIVAFYQIAKLTNT